jgi:xanthine permease XanP
MAERPKDLIYALDERPPAFQLLALGFQHASAICPYLVMVALVAGAARLPHDAARNALALAMIAVAFLTILQSLRFGWLGSGYLCPPVVSAIYLPSSMAAAATFGFPTMCGMVIFAGACEALVSRLVNRLRKLFPAVVSGVVIIAVGIELGKIGLGVLFEGGVLDEVRTEGSFVTASSVLVTMTSLAIWARGLPRLLCALIGILVGYAVAALLGVFPKDFALQLSESPFFALPDPSFLSYHSSPLS